MPYRLAGLGELSLHDSERRKVPVPRKALAVMAVLAAAGARSVPRDRLVALLWPESGEAGRASLKQTIYELRQSLGNANVVTGTAELSLDPAWVACDFAELEAAHAAGDWQRAIDLYAGPYLDGFHVRDSAEFDHWIDGRRAHYDSLLREALERVADAASQRGDHAAAVPLWRRLAAQDPLSGRVALNLMKALALAGDAAGALSHYQVYQRLLESELNVAPEPEVTAEAERIRARLAGTEAQTPRVAPSDSDARSDDGAQGPRLSLNDSDAPRGNRRLWIGLAATLAVIALTVATVRVAGARARVVASLTLPRNADMRVTVDQHVNRVYVDGGASFDAALTLLDGEMRAPRTLPAGAGVVIDAVTHWYWSGDYRARAVVVRNGRTDEELGRVPVPGCPHAFALSGEWVWVAQQCNDHISVIDSRRRQVVRHIAIPTLTRAEVGGAKGMGEIVVNRNTGVAYFTRDGLPHRIDPRSWELRETIGFDGPVMVVNEATNMLYVKVDGGLRVLDGATEKLVAEIALPSTPGRAAVGFGGKRVYATTNEGLVAVDGKTHRLLYVRSLGEGFVPDGVSIDVVRNRAYVIGNEAGGSRSLKVVSLGD